jgi:hypothetical protein
MTYYYRIDWVDCDGDEQIVTISETIYPTSDEANAAAVELVKSPVWRNNLTPKITCWSKKEAPPLTSLEAVRFGAVGLVWDA